MRTTGTHEREGVSHFGISIPGRHPLCNESIHVFIDVLPDFFNLACRTQISLYRGIAHLTMYATSDEPLEPMVHICSFPSYLVKCYLDKRRTASFLQTSLLGIGKGRAQDKRGHVQAAHQDSEGPYICVDDLLETLELYVDASHKV